MLEHDSVDGLAGRCVSRCVQWSELSTARCWPGSNDVRTSTDDPLWPV
jgi:hypothetical protein